MLFEHKVTKQPATKIENSARDYLQSRGPDILLADIKSYIYHVELHLSKENQRVFMMADMLLQRNAEQVNKDLAQSEHTKLTELGKKRSDMRNW